MTLRLLVTLIAAIFATQSAYAADSSEEATDGTEMSDDGPWNEHNGWYVEGTGGTNLFYIAIFSTGADASASGFSGGGWSGAAGYAFKSNFSAEVGFMQNFLKFDGEDSDGDDKTFSTHLNVPYVTARWDVPVFERFAFIAKIGLMFPSIAEKSVDAPVPALPFVGFGASYAITEKIDINFQYQGGVYIVVGAGLMSLGATYHF